jgi:SAM-dependent methyltransferase
MSCEYGALAAEVYDLDKPIGLSFGDVEYYKHLVAGIGGRILEPACGTGRILIPLLEAGHRVEGLDSSVDMLAVCRRHCQDRGLDPVLREADMTTFVQLAAYDAVIVPTGSITLLDGRKATLQALTCFRDSLVPGGLLFVDVPMPQPVAWDEPMRFWHNGPCLWTLQPVHVEHDAAANQTTRLLRYDKWQDGRLSVTELQRLRLQHWNLHEFQGLLAEAGFTGLAVTGYKNASMPRPGDGIWTFHAVAPHRPAGVPEVRPRRC